MRREYLGTSVKYALVKILRFMTLNVT